VKSAKKMNIKKNKEYLLKHANYESHIADYNNPDEDDSGDDKNDDDGKK